MAAEVSAGLALDCDSCKDDGADVNTGNDDDADADADDDDSNDATMPLLFGIGRAN